MALRFRCNSCGNRTRFDVVSTKRARQFQHFDLGGELRVEEEEVLSYEIDSVTCRWCGSTTAVETIESDEQAVVEAATSS